MFSQSYNHYGEFLQQKFGRRVHKIPINAGFTCPNRNGAVAFGGCTYCNIDSFTPEAARARIPVREQVENSIGYLKTRFKATAFIAYFQPYSNTYADLPHLQDLYEQALAHPEVVGISIGTRPDCIDAEKLNYLQELTRDYFVTVEYGIESVHDETLRLINRGHDYKCTVEGIHQTASRGIYVCGHLVFGFPNESRTQMLDTVDEVSRLPLDFVKLHNLHVVRYTELARQFKAQPFYVFSFDEWVDFICDVIVRLNPDFRIERLYGDAPPHLLIEPQWCHEKSAAEIIYAIQQRLETLDTCQGKDFKSRVAQSALA
ncbi:TIGR01212 family radical SAM protein [candidate division KSB1 bacterium]|nr:TIGR01212 family radical SAM protein [candidate division KSB1 bacterium]TDI87045.1 MAG: TIGR01212 family radical SAM protein [Caldithrix sp.]